MFELKEIAALVRAGDFNSGIGKLWDLWARIPDPKVETLNAYLVIEYGVAFALKAGKLDEAQTWADFAPAFKSIRHDGGEVEFLIGKVAFERGETELAKENFLIANVKSKGRIFEAKDEKYKKIIL